MNILAGEHVPVDRMAPDTPAALVEIVERLLEPHADARFADAAALLDALVVVAPPPTVRRKLAQLVREARAARVPSPPHGSTLPESPPAENGESRSTATAPGYAAPLPAPTGPDTGSSHHSPVPPGPAPSPPPHTSSAPSVASSEADGGGRPRRRRGAWLALGAGGVGVVTLATIALGAHVHNEAGATLEHPAPPTRPATLPGPAMRPPHSAPGPSMAALASTAPAARSETAAAPVAADGDAAHVDPAPTPPGPASQGETGHGSTTARATLRVAVIPWGKVWIDGHLVGSSPARARLEPGVHFVAAGVDGPGSRRRVELHAGESRALRMRIVPHGAGD